MPGPQIENGYTRIANELLEAICGAALSKRQYKVILHVIRQTYGFGKKSDVMTYSQIAKATGMHRRHVITAVHELADVNVLSVNKSGTDFRGGELNQFGLNKHYLEWATGDQISTSAKTVTSDQNGPITGDRNGPMTSAELVTHNRKKQKTTTKEKKAHEEKLPECVPVESWHEWEEHRRQIGKKLTPLAKSKTLNKLQRLSEEGHSPKEIIDFSIENGWQGLFPPNKSTTGRIGDATENVWADTI